MEETGVLRETLAQRDSQLSEARLRLEETNEAKDELAARLRKAQSEAARCQTAMDVANAALR